MTQDMKQHRQEIIEGVVTKLSEEQNWPPAENWPVAPANIAEALFDATTFQVMARFGLEVSGMKSGDTVRHPDLGDVTFLMAHGGQAFISYDGAGQCVSLERLTKA